jgi:hypothetical protein
MGLRRNVVFPERGEQGVHSKVVRAAGTGMAVDLPYLGTRKGKEACGQEPDLHTWAKAPPEEVVWSGTASLARL